jgi:2'-5' RNA ligase
MALDEVFSFRQTKHPIVLCAADGNDAFRMLHIRLALALRNSGLKVPIDRRLQPHMTLVYSGKEIAKTRLAAPISLEASEFVLIRSHHGEGRHDYLGRWPLGS